MFVQKSLASGASFYKLTSKELFSTDRKIVVVQKDGKSYKFFYDFEKPTSKN
jgi:hypothetical protein